MAEDGFSAGSSSTGLGAAFKLVVVLLEGAAVPQVGECTLEDSVPYEHTALFDRAQLLQGVIRSHRTFLSRHCTQARAGRLLFWAACFDELMSMAQKSRLERWYCMLLLRG